MRSRKKKRMTDIEKVYICAERYASRRWSRFGKSVCFFLTRNLPYVSMECLIRLAQDMDGDHVEDYWKDFKNAVKEEAEKRWQVEKEKD